ncbi:phosphotransferase [Tenggerimyces flavus]|uniref:Phosphotransferase n=1 Tax=Tenggerimyces flavus TaxID=1708749 RepID=A0ABV7YAR6_9ACTN|nr:aminoglycoside phosphotransferase family protein [Tenggerimyces flavus]
MRWVAEDFGDVLSVQALHDDAAPWLVRTSKGNAVLRSVTDRIGVSMVATGAAALLAAEEYGLPAPRLLASELNELHVTLETIAEGSTRWPQNASPALLRDAGAALARIHAHTRAPQQQLPYRPRPIAVDDFARDRRQGLMPTTPLLQKADEIIQGIAAPSGETVFLHGDVWPGNVMIDGERCVALIDWKTAGVGQPGVDVSELRKQVALTYGPDAPAHVQAGWESEAGRPAEDVAYWDATAALNTRTQLDEPELTIRRDAFLSRALSKLT